MNKSQERKLLAFASNLGFENPSVAKTINKGVIGFHYDSFEIKQVLATLGKHKKHNPDGRFIFVIERKQKILRVDTARQLVILGDGERAFNAIFKSV